MTWTYSDEYYKKYTRDTWNESADEYGPVARNLDKYNDALFRHAQPRAGARVLDVACGLGEPALTLGPMVAPGDVVGVDLSERMVEKANQVAKQMRRDNVRFDVMDAEELTLPDASFDLVVCRFGLQIVTNPDKAIAEARRVLKRGGRLAATVWASPGERCPAIHVIIGPMLKHAEPDESGYLPTPYEMGGPGELVDILRKAGFRDAKEERVTRSWTFADEDAYFRGILKGTPIGHSLSEEDPPVQEQVIRESRENLQRFTTPDGIVMPSEAVVVSAIK